MDPVTIGAGITAVAALIGGLMNTAAQKEMAKENRLQQSRDKAFESQVGAQRQMGASQQQALAQLVENMKGVYL